MRMGTCLVLLSAGVLLVCGPACSTLMFTGRDNKYLYSGTRENIHAFEPRKPAPVDEEPGADPRPEIYAFHTPPGIAFFDFPCSLALDTVLVPITLPLELIHGGSPPPAPKPAVPQKKD